MHEALVALLNHDPVDAARWRSFWDRLSGGGLERGETVALLASLSTRLPEHDTLSALVTSLDERRPPVDLELPATVNIVGTGGGPRTFNVSTAAAFVAAAAGVRVVKTGSRAYTSSCGSIDLLERLGVPLTKSYEHTADTLERYGIAFAGHFVYPPELMLLARSILPLGMRAFGRFLNALGPFLAALPVTAQVTGVSDPALLPPLRDLAATVPTRTIWLAANDLGADELFSFADNVLYPNDGRGEIRLARQGPGGLDDLRPAEPGSSVVEHFLEVLAGQAGPVATETVCLNAAALAVASGRQAGWSEAIAAAEEAVRSGAAVELVNRMRAPVRTGAALLTKAGASG